MSAPALSGLSDLDIRIVEPLCAVFRRTLKKVGLKYTPERARILDAVISMGDLFQADQLMDKLRAEGHSGAVRAGGVGRAGAAARVSKATVYRTIKLLADAGIIQQVLLDSDQAHYQLAYGRRPAGLIVNGDTGAAKHVDVPELDAIAKRICEREGLALRGWRLVIHGGAG